MRRVNLHHWRGYPERRWIQFLILRILYERPMYGYQLLEEIEKRSAGSHRLQPGSLYTILRRMEHRGMLESKWERTETGPDRRVYKVTDVGTRALRMGLEMVARRKVLMDDLMDFYKKQFQAKEGTQAAAFISVEDEVRGLGEYKELLEKQLERIDQRLQALKK